MNKESMQFLEQLITTPSPSGAEYALQQKWIDYTKQFADKVETDAVGNVIASYTKVELLILKPETSYEKPKANY